MICRAFRMLSCRFTVFRFVVATSFAITSKFSPSSWKMGLISLKEMMPVRSDTDVRGKDLGRGDPFSDSAVSKDHRFHDFRYTVPLGFVGSKGHDQTDHEPPRQGIPTIT